MKVYAIMVKQENNGDYEDYWHSKELFRITLSKETAVRFASSMTRYPDIITGFYDDEPKLVKWEFVKSVDNCFYYTRKVDAYSLDACNMVVTIEEKYVFE